MERHKPDTMRWEKHKSKPEKRSSLGYQKPEKGWALKTKKPTTKDSQNRALTKSDGRNNNPHQRRHQPAPYTRKKYRSSQNNQGNRRSDDEINPHHILRTTEGSPQDLKSYTINKQATTRQRRKEKKNRYKTDFKRTTQRRSINKTAQLRRYGSHRSCKSENLRVAG